jgi:hypothetical protein
LPGLRSGDETQWLSTLVYPEHDADAVAGESGAIVVTYADILRDLEPLNGCRATKDRITYNSLWNHAKRHYDLDGLLDHWGRRVEKKFEDILGIPAPCSTGSSARRGRNQVRRNGESVPTLLETMLNESSMTLDGDWEGR